MPIKVIDRYKVECKNCGYTWDTKYAKIPAKCPSCSKSIHNDIGNYKIINEYTHNKPTKREIEKENKRREERNNRIGVWCILFVFFIFGIFIISFWKSLILFIFLYYLFKYRKNFL